MDGHGNGIPTGNPVFKIKYILWRPAPTGTGNPIKSKDKCAGNGAEAGRGERSYSLIFGIEKDPSFNFFPRRGFM